MSENSQFSIQLHPVKSKTRMKNLHITLKGDLYSLHIHHDIKENQSVDE